MFMWKSLNRRALAMAMGLNPTRTGRTLAASKAAQEPQANAGGRTPAR